jgi:hypothetical protein
MRTKDKAATDAAKSEKQAVKRDGLKAYERKAFSLMR